MKIANHTSEADSPAAIPVDPFAVDFFGHAGMSADDELSENELPVSAERRRRRPKSDWFRVLPKVSNRDAALSNALAALPARVSDDLLGRLTETIAKFTFSEDANCEVISVTEVGLATAMQGLLARPRVFLTISCRTEDCRGAIVLDVDFASSLVDSVLDGPGDEFSGRRGLSPIETTIVEFMAANAVSSANELMGSQLLVLDGIGHAPETIFSDHERGAELVLSVRFGERTGIVTALLPGALLRNLSGGLIGRSRNFRDAESVFPRIRTRLVTGFTTLDSASVVFLEPDDVVMIENPLMDLTGGPIGAGPYALVGGGHGFRLRGAAEENGFNGNLLFRIDDILSEETRRAFTPAKFKMDEKERESPTETVAEELMDDVAAEAMVAEEEQLSPALENIQVALRVEIAGNKISLRELQDLRAGQIIALGCSPNDPVRLVTDNNDDPVAAGELIEIEGQLGVRLTRVFI